MKRILMLFLAFFAALVVKAQANYDAGSISKDLLPYASAVIRDKETTIEVKSASKVNEHVKMAITILNNNGDHFGRIAIWHNSMYDIRSIKGAIYNSTGVQIAKFSKSDFEDRYAAANYAVFEDSRIETYSPAVTDYPYTVAYEYDVQSSQSLEFADWQPNENIGIAIEKNSYTFNCKPDFKIRYNENNLPVKGTVTTTKDGLTSYNWLATNLKAMRSEPYSPPNEVYLSSLKIAPENFVYSGLSGSFTDWAGLGKWVYDKLLTNRGLLPETTVAYIKNLTSGITDPKLKAKKVYEYMQQKTRYVSIQVGIGGYQPMQAFDVDKSNYGDCKGLVNYTQALLKAADIESWYCVVQAGAPKVSMLKDFASMNQGDHIILCLPFKNDTTWLECTSQQIPFGFLSDFTDDRLVLACTAQGGKLLRTPKYTSDVNAQIRKATFDISAEGELSGNMQTIFKGVQYDNREEFINKSQTDRAKELKRLYTINNLEINDLSYKQDKTTDPTITENIKITAPEFAALTNNNYYFTVNSVNRITNAPRELRTRNAPVYINEGYTDEDEITYKIPDNCRLTKIPLNVHLSKPFGTFDATVTSENGKLIYRRKMKIIDGTYSKDLYEDLVEFYQTIVDADSYSATLVKKT